MFWEDDASKKLAEAGRKNTSDLWKVSNLVAVPGMLSVFALVGGVVLLVIAASAYFIFGQSPTAETIKGVVPIIALLLFILAGLLYVFFLAYIALVAIIAFDFEDISWGAVIALGVIFTLPGFLAPFYKHIKKKEIMEKGVQPKKTGA